jgi:hypothetical protein
VHVLAAGQAGHGVVWAFLQRRAWALPLVCNRLKRDHPKRLAGLNRDVRHLLVKYASMVEYIYVPSDVPVK